MAYATTPSPDRPAFTRCIDSPQGRLRISRGRPLYGRAVRGIRAGCLQYLVVALFAHFANQFNGIGEIFWGFDGSSFLDAFEDKPVTLGAAPRFLLLGLGQQIGYVGGASTSHA